MKISANDRLLLRLILAVIGLSLFSLISNFFSSTESNVSSESRLAEDGLSFTQISAQNSHGLAISSQGKLFAWGYNEFGQVGDGSYFEREFPVEISSDFMPIEVDAGENFSIALASNGSLWGWGNNEGNPLGIAGPHLSYGGYLSPQKITSIDDVASVSAGSFHSLVLKSDGTVWILAQDEPKQVLELRDIVEIDAYNTRNIAADSQGNVWVWDVQLFGYGVSERPEKIGRVNHKVVQVAAGRDHFAILDETGMVWTVGGNSYGQLGDGTLVDRKELVPVQRLENISFVTLGDYVSGAVDADGKVWLWGNDDSYSNSNELLFLRPLQVSALQDYRVKMLEFVNFVSADFVFIDSDGQPNLWHELSADSGHFYGTVDDLSIQTDEVQQEVVPNPTVIKVPFGTLVQDLPPDLAQHIKWWGSGGGAGGTAPTIDESITNLQKMGPSVTEVPGTWTPLGLGISLLICDEEQAPEAAYIVYPDGSRKQLPVSPQPPYLGGGICIRYDNPITPGDQLGTYTLLIEQDGKTTPVNQVNLRMPQELVASRIGAGVWFLGFQPNEKVRLILYKEDEPLRTGVLILEQEVHADNNGMMYVLPVPSPQFVADEGGHGLFVVAQGEISGIAGAGIYGDAPLDEVFMEH